MSLAALEQIRDLSQGLSPHEKLQVIDDLVHQLMQPTEPPVKKPFPSIRGILANSGPVPSIEDIQEMRREAFANFPREEFFEMIRAAIDTHALIWYVNNDPRLSAPAAEAIDNATAAGEQIAVSSMSLVEIIYLIEKHRIGPTTFDIVRALLDSNGLLVEVPMDRAVALAMRLVARSLIPELPDRVIAATAVHLGVPLISADSKIEASGVMTIW